MFSITASTTDQEIENAISFLDMRAHAIERRDDAAAVIEEQGDQEVLQLHECDGVTVLLSPVFGYAVINEKSTGVGNSLFTDNGDVGCPEDAVKIWRGEQV